MQIDTNGVTGELIDGDDKKADKENSKERSNSSGPSRSGDDQSDGGGSEGDGEGDGTRPEAPNDSGDDQDDDGDDDAQDGAGGDGGGDGDEDETSEEEAEGSEGDDESNENVDAAAPVVAAPAAQPEGNWLSYDQLMSETYPAKSKAVYQAAFTNFELFLKSEKKFEPNVAPDETSFLNYFRYLRNVKAWGASTIWSMYSRLNAVLKRRYRGSLKLYPGITDLLKSYEVGHRVKKASVFTPQQAFNIFDCLILI